MRFAARYFASAVYKYVFMGALSSFAAENKLMIDGDLIEKKISIQVL